MDNTLKLILLHHKQGAKYEDTKQALFDLLVVVKSLPSKDEKYDKVMDKVLEMYDEPEALERKHYIYGFNACFRWLSEVMTK